jgi:hypothetical protein
MLSKDKKNNIYNIKFQEKLQTQRPRDVQEDLVRKKRMQSKDKRMQKRPTECKKGIQIVHKNTECFSVQE